MNTAKYLKQLGGETVIYGLSATITRFIGIFLVPLYTRIFAPSDYGIIALIASLDGLITTFVVMGMDNASARWFYLDSQGGIEGRKKVISTWFWFQAAVSIVATILITTCSGVLSEKMLGSSALAGLFVITSLTFPLAAFKKVLGNWFRYQRRAWESVTYSLTTSLLTIGLTIYFVLVLRWGLPGIYWAQLIALFAMSIVAVATFRDWIAPWHFSIPLLREMLVFALPLIPASIAGWVTASADRFILNAYTTTSEIGLYSLAATLASGMVLITGAFQMAWGPFAFSIFGKADANRVYSKVLSIYSWLGCGLATALTLFTPLILDVLTTTEYRGAASSVAYLAFSALAVGATYIAALGCGIAKKSIPLSVSTFIGAGINTLLNFLLIPRLGKDGAAVATMGAYAIATAYLFYASQKLYPIPYRFRDPLICLGFSWLLIGLDHLLSPAYDVFTFSARVGLCLLFIPLAFHINLIRPAHIKNWSIAMSRRLGFMGS